MIYFKEVSGAERIAQGVLAVDLDAELVYWGLDELGFDPYDFIFTEINGGISLCWTNNDPLKVDDGENWGDPEDIAFSMTDQFNIVGYLENKQWHKLNRLDDIVACDKNGIEVGGE